MMAGKRPIPNNGIINPSNANEGMVCNIAAIFMTISDVFFVLVNKIPSGTAMIVAINKAINDICICSMIVESNCPYVLLAFAKIHAWVLSPLRLTNI